MVCITNCHADTTCDSRWQGCWEGWLSTVPAKQDPEVNGDIVPDIHVGLINQQRFSWRIPLHNIRTWPWARIIERLLTDLLRFDNHSASLIVDNVRINLSLSDTTGQKGYDRLWTLMCPQSDVFPDRSPLFATKRDSKMVPQDQTSGAWCNSDSRRHKDVGTRTCEARRETKSATYQKGLDVAKEI